MDQEPSTKTWLFPEGAVMHTSIDVAKSATKLAVSTRDEERQLIGLFKKENIITAAVDIGGSISDSMTKILERTLVAAKRGGLIHEEHTHEGAVIGACRDALMQVMERANNLNVGGKIGIARADEHISVCIFLSIGLLHLNEVVIGIGHRSIKD